MRHATAERPGGPAPYFVALGTIEPRKNQVALLEAFCELPRSIADRHTLVLVGAGAWNEEAIRRRVDAALDDLLASQQRLDGAAP